MAITFKTAADAVAPFDNDNVHTFIGQQTRGIETRQARADNNDICGSFGVKWPRGSKRG